MSRKFKELPRRSFILWSAWMAGTLALIYCVRPSADQSESTPELLVDGVQPEYEDPRAASYNFLTTREEIANIMGVEILDYFDNQDPVQIGGKVIDEQEVGNTTTVLHEVGTGNFVSVVESRSLGRQIYQVSGVESVKTIMGDGVISAVQPLKGGVIQVFFEGSSVSSAMVVETGSSELNRQFLTQGRMTSDRHAIINNNGVVTIAEAGQSRTVRLNNYDGSVMARNALFVNENEPMVVFANNKVIYPVRRSGEDGIVLGIQSLEITRKPDRDVRLSMTRDKLTQIGLPVRHVTNRRELVEMGLERVNGEEVYAAIYLGDRDGAYYPWIQVTEGEVYEHTAYFT